MINLKLMRIWVCFIVTTSKDGKRKEKRPISAKNKPTGTSKNYATTWVTYEEAMASAKQFGFDGVGFVVPEGIFFLDIDHRNQNDPFVQELLSRFNTYAERSISGEGFHIYGRCDMTRIPTEVTDGQKRLRGEYYTKNPENGIELYIGGLTNRFALFTGNVICNRPMEDCTNAILQTLESTMRRPFAGERNTDTGTSTQDINLMDDISSIVEKLRSQKNGAKFSDLYDNGDISAYRSHSEADAALCALIAFRVGNNAKVIDDVFRTSALYRKKWERKDYRIKTIKCGIDACQGAFYSKCESRKKISVQNRLDPKPEKKNLSPTDYSDVGQANVFAEQYGHCVKYTEALGFHVFDGRVWNASSIKAQGLSQELTERQQAEANDKLAEAIRARVVGDESLLPKAEKDYCNAKDYKKYVKYRRNSERIKATLTEAKPKLEISVADLDADGYLLNTPGGTVDLRSGEIRPHKSTDYITKITAVSPNTVNTIIFEKFLREVTCGDDDLARYLQDIAGMCLVGHVILQKLIIAYGEGGNGKSTLFNLLARVLGDYAGALSSETLTAYCRKNKDPEIAELRGKRLVIAAELEEGMRLDTAVVKKLCSTDKIIAAKKYKDPFTFDPSHTLILCTNHLPKICTTDRGTWDRIIVVPFNARFRNCQHEIRNMADYLYEQCAGAVLNWMICGAKRFIDNQYFISLPVCVIDTIEQYKSDSDWFNTFLKENCVVGREYCARSGELYNRYKEFCDITGEYRRSLAAFKKSLTEHGFVSKRTNQGTYVTGLKFSE